MTKRGLLEEGLGSARRSGDPAPVALLLSSLANSRGRDGDRADQRALLEESLTLRRQAGHEWGVARSLIMLGHLDLDRGERDGARARFAEALEIVRRLRDSSGLASALEGIARGCEEASTALRLAAFAGAIREETGEAPPEARTRELDEHRRQLKQRLAGRAEAVEAEGRTMSLDAAIQEALATTRPGSS